jgi:hypothetical protein
MGTGKWGLDQIPNPQPPIPNHQSPIPNPDNIDLKSLNFKNMYHLYKKIYKIKNKCI